jgi:hypothetical protein
MSSLKGLRGGISPVRRRGGHTEQTPNSLFILDESPAVV